MKSPIFLLLSLPLVFLPGAAHSEESDLLFQGARYPIEIAVSPETPVGAVIYETPLAEVRSGDYDTVLIEGLMPDPGVMLQVQLQNGAASKTYDKPVLHRFPNGRFWAKYKVAAFTREPLKITVLNAGVSQKHTLSLYNAEVFSAAAERENQSAGLPADHQPGPELALPKSLPFPITRRAAWKAAPPKKSYTEHTPALFTLHHTAAHSPADRAAAVEEMQFIQDYHQNGKGWIDIAYHFLISPQGDIFEGRPIGVVGAHVANRNANNVGISIMGNYHPPADQRPTQKVLNAIATIGRYLKTTYKIDKSNFFAHREIGSTDCPGDNLYAKMPGLKTQIFRSAVLEPAVAVRADASFDGTPAGEFPALNQLIGCLADSL